MKTSHTSGMKRGFLAVAASVLLLLCAAAAGADVAGPIKVSANGRYFVDQQGQPFFWLGDTAWPLFVQYSKSQAEAYLKNRSAKGFTVIQGVLVWSQGTGSESKRPGTNPNGDRPWIDDDPAQPNDAFFRHVDYLVEFAQQQGLVLAMLPTWGYYVNDAKLITLKNARAYGRWLGTRYRSAPNVIWVNGGAALPRVLKVFGGNWHVGCARGTAGRI